MGREYCLFVRGLCRESLAKPVHGTYNEAVARSSKDEGTRLMATDAKRTTVLTDPSARPGADVVIFDGHCRFCRGGVERLARLDRRGQLAFLSLHDERVAEWYPDLTHEQLMADMYLVDRSGTRHRGAAAVRYLTRKLPILWALAPLLHIPGSLPIWQWGYSQFARRRYRWGKVDDCADGTCSVHFGPRDR
jgi:predicted DCC family thiol-disulfide oxidoreductase YuxK